MSTADLDHNDKLAVEKKEKLEWVTPKISLMVSQVTLGTGKGQNINEFTGPPGYGIYIGPS